jgi:hypothetical protein
MVSGKPDIKTKQKSYGGYGLLQSRNQSYKSLLKIEIATNN